MHFRSRRTRCFAAALVLGATATASVNGDDSVGRAAPALPTERLAIDDLEYLGAFRITSETIGASSANYATGTLGYHADNDSLFLAGYAPGSAIAEFEIPTPLGTGGVVEELPLAATAVQPFTTLLDRAEPTGPNGERNPDGIDRIDGLFVDDGRLIVNAERWYDAAGTATDTTLTVDVDDIGGDVSGYFEMDGGVHAGGYMSPVPAEWRGMLGGPVLTGWASNTSIISRHSVGPTLFTFDPADLAGRNAPADPTVATIRHMDFPFASGDYLAPDALVQEPGGASALWNVLSRASYAFIAPGTATFVVVGSTGGVDSGIGYKIEQDNGNLCGGPCPYRHDDVTNAYWLFDVNDILAADDVHLPRPYAFGSWSVPFDADGQHAIIGGVFDPASSTLYLSLDKAGQVGAYDRPPLVLAYAVPADGSFTGAGIDAAARALEPAVPLDR